MTGTELERITTTQKVAVDFANSGYFSDARTAEQAFVKIMAGAEMGLSPFQSMTGIHIIQSKPVVGAGLLAAMLDQHPDYDYQVEWEPNQATATACTVVVFKGGKERGRSRFSLEDKQRAGLTQQNWSKYPTAMLYARAMSQAVRWYAPGLTGTSVYVEGEIGPDTQKIPDVPPVAKVTAYVDPDDPLDDVPFVDATPAPLSAESPNDTPTGVEGQTEAPARDEPAPSSSPVVGGLIIESLDDATALIRTLNGEQLAVMKRMLEIKGKTTKVDLAHSLLDQRFEWDSQDILAEMAGWS